TAGSYTVTYSVTDAAGNSASANRSVEVVDSSAPVITLEGDNPVAIEAGTPFIDPGASAEDDVDGDITDRILVDGEVDIEAAGSYQLTYTVSDSAGNTATVIRTVNVVAASAPIIVLLGDNPYEVELGVEFSDPGATANDAFDG
ncbi:cell wall-binding protein, partial [Candidatus Endoriftia persephone str. Guaymas]|nr:cell wall-binding protein [Candidatus Endoriftia persephone str. Guaymas]